MNIKQNIIQKLVTTETNYNVKIILAIESGSRASGFAAKNADYDCRFIYVHPQDWYLSIQERKDFITYAIDEIYDIKGIDISRALQYIIKPNASIYEWLSSNITYICNKSITNQLQTLATNFFNPISISYHYLYLARKTLNDITNSKEAKIKKYFYTLRPIANLNYIWQHRKMPSMEYAQTLKNIETPPQILSAINTLTQEKMLAGEHDKIPKHELLISYCQKEVEKFTDNIKTMTHTKNRDYEFVDTIFRDIIVQAW